MWLTWLPEVLRAAGLTVHEVPGWRSRSAAEDPDASTYSPRGVIIHETRSPRIASDADEIRVLVEGRVGLSGPIAQLYLGRNGHWHVVAAGLCHHVKTGWGGPFAGLGNPRLLGIEAAHTTAVDAAGRRLETWADKPAQYESYLRGVAAIRAHTGWPAPVGHKEHQPGDKPDPEFDMPGFRTRVQTILDGGDMADVTTAVTVYGGTSMGRPVPDRVTDDPTLKPDPTGRYGNSLVDLLQHIRGVVDELKATRLELTETDRADIAQKVTALIGQPVTTGTLKRLLDAAAGELDAPQG